MKDEEPRQPDNTTDSEPASPASPEEADPSTPNPEVVLPNGAIQNLTEGVEGEKSTDNRQNDD